jgi:CDP-glucose 4,6-dehydratase
MARNNFWKDRPVFITGCTGLVGSWLTKYLLAEGAHVVGLVRDWVPKSNLVLEGNIDRIVLVRGSVEDYSLIERALNEYEIDTVFHLAAQTIVGIANRNPLSTFETNIKGTWNVLEAVRRVPCVSRVIVASSDKAYGDQEVLPYTETTPLEGRHPYDVSKSCTDLLSISYHKSYKLPVCVTRCGNFFGGGDLNFNRIVPGTIRSVHNGQRPVIRSDGKFIRDYIYVEDAALAYAALAEGMDDRSIHGEAFNFSNENQVTVRGIVDEILRLMDAEHLKPIIQNKAKNEIKHQYLSARKARKLLGWKPQFTLEEGLGRTVDWYRRFFVEAERKR